MGRKNCVDISSDKKWNITQENLDWVTEGNINRETQSLLIAAQNNAMRNKYKALYSKNKTYDFQLSNINRQDATK